MFKLDANGITELDNRLNAKIDQNYNDVTSSLAETEKRLNKPKTVEQVIEKMVNKQPVTIVAYGDSITWGYIPGDGGQTANPYPLSLQTLLRDYYGYQEITVVNLGDSGKQSDEFASDSYISGVVSENPDMVLFMCGINDCKGGTSGGVIIPVEDYKANIANMTNKLDYPMIFMTPTFFQGSENEKKRFVQYVRAMREMAQQMNVELIDLYDIVIRDLDSREIGFGRVSADGIHYSDEYYKRLAEFIFTYGLCSNDIIVSDEKFISPIDPIFKWDTDVGNYYTSDINPMNKNIHLIFDEIPFRKVTVYIFADRNDLDLQSLYVPNTGSSAYNTVEINGVTYQQPTFSYGHTIWKLREKAIPLKHGLNKIVYNSSGDTVNESFLLIYGLNIIKRQKKVVGIEDKFKGSVNINADEPNIQKTIKIATFKDNNFKKITVKCSPSSTQQGVSFGTGSVLIDGIVEEYPIATVLESSTGVNFYYLQKNGNKSLYNVNGDLNYDSILESTEIFNKSAENILEVTLLSDSYKFVLNGTTLFTLPKTAYNLGVLDVWGYSINTNVSTIDGITVSS